jgi:formylglycine-generating enzyme required for sulfatase activity/serine/threonine protein kinase
MKECPNCHRCFPDNSRFCGTDGGELEHSIKGEPVLDGRYQLIGRLGQGGMGAVYEARHIMLKTRHAVKIILPDLVSNDPEFVTRFRQEAMAAAAIRHHNVIAVTDYGVIGGAMPFLVMEFIQGRSLHKLLSTERRLSPERALEIMTPIAAGVGAAHRRGIVHRDLKPLNIMIEDDVPIREGIKVLDFGLAKIKSGEWLGSFVTAKTTGFMGSPSYMAPEQWSDDEPEQSADIYSLGIILYQMLSGDVPFKGPSIPSIMKKHLMSEPPRFAHRGVSVPLVIEDVVRHALAKLPEERPATVSDFVGELRDAIRAVQAARLRADVSLHTQLMESLTDIADEHFARAVSSVTDTETAPHSPDNRAHHEAGEREETEQAALARAEESARLRADARAREEAEAQRLAEEEAARRLAEEEAARLRAVEEERRAEEERRRQEAEEERRREEEAKRLAEEEESRRIAAAEAERKRVEEEEEVERLRAIEEALARKRAEELRKEREAAELRRKEEARRREEEKRLKEEEEARERAAQEEARKRAEEEKRLAEEAEAKRLAEEEAAGRLAEEEAARLRAVEEERERAEQERLRLVEQERRRAAEAEEARRAEEERRRQEAEEERRREEEAKRLAEEEESRRIAAAEAERKRVKEEQARLAAEEEDERRRVEEKAEQERRREEEARKRAAEERRKEEEEAERKRVEEEESRLRLAEETHRAEEKAERKRTEKKPARRSRVKGAGRPQQPEAEEQAVIAHEDLTSEETLATPPLVSPNSFATTPLVSPDSLTHETVAPPEIAAGEASQPGDIASSAETSPMQEQQATHSPALDADVVARKRQVLPLLAGGAAAIVLLGIFTTVYLLKSAEPGDHIKVGDSKTGKAPVEPDKGAAITRQPDMVSIPGGTFQMGRNDVSQRPDEYNQFPAHAVTVKPFYMDRTEVTNAEYAEFVRATRHPVPKGEPASYWTPWNGDAPPPGQEQWPVRNVSVADAEAFAAWRSHRDGVKYRLPTEEEWEYAARGNDGRIFPWGQQWGDKRANVDSELPKPVGSFPEGASATGVLDLIGNVREWTSTRARLYPGNEEDFERTEQGWVVMRGGSYRSKANDATQTTATARMWLKPTEKHATIGFRLVRDSP